MTDMGHMEFLREVSNKDVRELENKEATYRGSWKQRGGIGAFMMLARKWDRMEAMLQMARGTKYDIFAAITADPSGRDGSVLAEVRDLRRYLLLVEAEMAYRKVVTTYNPVELTSTPNEARAAAGLPPVKPRVYGPFDKETHELVRPGTPEDGGHHARVLQDGLGEKDVPAGLMWCYKNPLDNGLLLVNRGSLPKDMWYHLPRLPVELNHKEWEETVPEYQQLYRRDEAAAKWVMAPEFREHWGRA